MESIQKKGIILALVLASSGYAIAQIDLSKYEFGAYASAFVYQGDLSPSFLGSLKTIKPGAGIFVNRFLNRSFSLRANFSYGMLSGNDAAYSTPAYRKQRNFNFTTPVIETSVVEVWNILGKNGAENNYGFSPYIFTGLGFSFLNIKRDWSKLNTSYFAGETGVFTGLAADKAHHVPDIIPVVPVGIGLRYAIKSHFAVNTEFSYRFTATDYLDGFSKSADPSKNDHYYTISAGLIYRFGKQNTLACPKLKK
jgi:hypothetical protein